MHFIYVESVINSYNVKLKSFGLLIILKLYYDEILHHKINFTNTFMQKHEYTYIFVDGR